MNTTFRQGIYDWKGTEAEVCYNICYIHFVKKYQSFVGQIAFSIETLVCTLAV